MRRLCAGTGLEALDVDAVMQRLDRGVGALGCELDEELAALQQRALAGPEQARLQAAAHRDAAPPAATMTSPRETSISSSSVSVTAWPVATVGGLAGRADQARDAAGTARRQAR